jgi:hypothetical protein
MIWRNPWAWLGLASLALPILIHLLGLGRAKVVPFPTLRFLDASKLLPTRRTRIHDAALLVVRLAILFAAVAALARPLWLSANRKRVVESALARAIIVERGLGAPESLSTNATASIVVQSSNPAREISGAAQWLERQPGRRELVIVSHFRRGSIDSSDLANVPRAIGVRLVRLELGDSTVIARAQTGAGTVNARTTLGEQTTTSEWTTAPSPAPEIATLLVAPGDRARADAAVRAALVVGIALPLDSTRSVAVAYPGASLPPSTPIDSAWMIAAAARIRADSTLIDAASLSPAVAADTSGLVVARNGTNQPVVMAKRSAGNLLLVAAFDPGSLASAALLSAIAKARSTATPVAPGMIASESLAAWQRAPAADRSAAALGDESDGRWLWIAVLILLGIEALMRRSRREAQMAAEVVRDRAA